MNLDPLNPKRFEAAHSLGALETLVIGVEKYDSKLAKRMTEHLAIIDSYFFPTFTCPTCKKEKTDPIDLELIMDGNECTGCDHVRGDVEDIMRDGANEVLEEMGDLE